MYELKVRSIMLCLLSFWVREGVTGLESSRLGFAEQGGRICGGNTDKVVLVCCVSMIMGAWLELRLY